jgi:hypothetical protein
MIAAPHQMELRQRKPKGDRLDPGMFASDDQRQEEIERLFKNGENREQSRVTEEPSKPKKRIDPLYYVLYAEGDQSPAEIEARFAILGQSVENDVSVDPVDRADLTLEQ